MKNKDKLIDAIGNIDDKYIKEAHEIKSKRFEFNWALTGKILTGVLCLFLVVVAIPNLFGMGGASKSSEPMESYNYVKDEETSAKYAGIGGQGGIATDSARSELVIENKKLIVTGYINIETLDFDDILNSLENNIKEANGYIQSSSISTNRYESRYYNATIRIPADKYDGFLAKTKESGNVTWYSEDVDDITDAYTDLEARLSSLKAEEEKVMEFYDKANDLNELMSVEARLTDIRYEIESIEARIKNYDLLTAYSTLNITITETKAYTKTNDNFFSRLSLSFTNGFTNFINGIENFVIDLVYNIWTIILVVIVVVVVIVVIKKIKKNRK